MSEKIKVLLEICIITLAAYFLADAAYVFLGSGPAAQRDDQLQVVAPAPAPVKREALSAFAGIGRRNLFKAQLAKPKPKPKPKAEPDASPITELPVSASLRLLGTVYSPDEALRRAVILNGKDQDILRQGQKIGGYTVQDILRRAVVVKSSSREEIIVIDGNDAEVARRASAMRPLSRRALDRYFGDLATMAEDIRIESVTRKGAKGLAVTGLRRGSLLHEAGLRQKDVILSANGVSLGDPADLLRFRRMLGADRINLELLRDNRPFTLNLEIVN